LHVLLVSVLLMDALVTILCFNNNNIKNYNNKRIYNAPFPKDTKRQIFLLQGEWDEDFEIMRPNP